jgi:hypothetical protein
VAVGLEWAAGWDATHVGDAVVVGVAGSDGAVVLDLLPAGGAALVLDARERGRLGEVPEGCAWVADRLVALGALVPTASPVPLACAVVPLAEGDGPAAVALAAELGGHRDLVGSGAAVDLTIAVRAGSSLEAGVAAVGAVPAPGLLVDLGYHDVVGIGPWWVGTAGSCPACYLGRLRARWGDLPAPPEPAVTRWMPAVAALVAGEVAAIERRATHLVDGACSWNLRDGTSTLDPVLRLPWCAACGGRR